MCMLTYLSVHVCLCAHTRKCAYVYLLCPRASLMFLHLVKFQAGAVRLAHKLLLCRRDRGVTEAFCLFQCQRQPHRSAKSDREEEARLERLKVYSRDCSHLPRRMGDPEILGN